MNELLLIRTIHCNSHDILLNQFLIILPDAIKKGKMWITTYILSITFGIHEKRQKLSLFPAVMKQKNILFTSKPTSLNEKNPSK